MADARRAPLKDQTDVSGARGLIVEARFYDDLQDAMLEGAVAELKAAGLTHDVITVPGALEIPAAIAIAVDAAATNGKPYDAAIALGCVIRGDTIHFEIVSQESSRALMDLAVARKLPLGNGILTVNTEAQAWARARASELNKGGDAARGRDCDAAHKAPAGAGLIMADNNKKPPAGTEKKANRRGAARLAAVQALYQMDIGGAGINDIFAEFESHWLGNEVEGDTYLPAEAAFFRDVVSGVVRDQKKLDPLIDEALSKGWPLKRIEAILRAVLRAGAYELEHRKDVPGRVVVSEYVDVANAFVDREETGMVNAVLDQIGRQFRGDEFGRG
ncbi:transcription antitermination factor NusB/6,7-dimethyl-8-ribityllumazine synthase [Bradyrhizobium sp. GM7.3]